MAAPCCVLLATCPPSDSGWTSGCPSALIITCFKNLSGPLPLAEALHVWPWWGGGPCLSAPGCLGRLSPLLVQTEDAERTILGMVLAALGPCPGLSWLASFSVSGNRSSCLKISGYVSSYFRGNICPNLIKSPLLYRLEFRLSYFQLSDFEYAGKLSLESH